MVKTADTKTLAVLTRPQDFKFCISEGGSAQCAVCREKDGTGGPLPCDAVRMRWPGKGKGKKNGKNLRYQDCPDSLHTGSYFSQNMGAGWCKSFGHKDARLGIATTNPEFPFGSINWGKA